MDPLFQKRFRYAMVQGRRHDNAYGVHFIEQLIGVSKGQSIQFPGELCGRGAVVVKVCKPQQDLRFDLPAIGALTIQTMASVNASCLAVEAGKTIIIERETVFREAGRAGIAIVAMTDPKDLS